MKKICVFTGTRAEYGLLYWLMKDLKSHPQFELQILVSGSHYSPEFGLTYQQIIKDGFAINEKVEMLLSSDTAIGTAKSIGVGILGYADSLARLDPDFVLILGDRYEALAIAQTAMILRIPIIHLAGGEVTEGAYDDSIRHAITKFSYLHFTSNEVYKQRVMQLGESPNRVFNVGSVGLDHLQRTQFMKLTELSDSLSFELKHKSYFVVTYHPVTLDKNEDPVDTFNNICSALGQFPKHKIIFTYPNADDGGRKIIPLINNYVDKNSDRAVAVCSLGQQRYLSAIKYCSAVIGNSSSGIAEVPSFGVPTINIGNRQTGRLTADSVINCKADRKNIFNAIARGISGEHTTKSKNTVNPYGTGNASEKIIKILENIEVVDNKVFFDIGR